MSRYNNLDNTKQELIQIRVSTALKKRFKLWCKINDVNGGMSGGIIMLIKGIMATEDYNLHTAPAISRFGWAIERVLPFIKGHGNGKKKFMFWAS